MIIVSGEKLNVAEFQNEGHFDRVERQVLTVMAGSEDAYEFDSGDLLTFELGVRRSIIEAAISLYQSGASFTTFDMSRCNMDYWILTENGGFRLKESVQPAKAVLDIFQNGRLYAFECATAMIIIYYKAVISSIGEREFNQHFQGLYLRSWHSDRELVLITRDSIDELAGDVRYFKNPDVHPKHAELQGENAVDLGDGTYFGHGLGILTGEQIIQALNRYRKPGATRSAYLLKQATRPNIKVLLQLKEGIYSREPLSDHERSEIVIRVGTFKQRIG